MRREFFAKQNLNLVSLFMKTSCVLAAACLCSAAASAWASKPTAAVVKKQPEPAAKTAVEATKETKTEKESVPEASEKVPSELTSPSKKVIEDINKGFTAIAEAALPAVVNVATTQIIEMKDRGFDFPKGFPGIPEELFRDFFDFERSRRVQSLGSGFIIISYEGKAYIVTNYHVIADAKKISIFLNDKTELEATLHAYDERTDIAILEVKTDSLPIGKRKLPTLEWGDSRTVRVGEWVLAIGNPFGLGSTVTNGIISNISRDLMTPSRNSYVDSFLQHSAQINMGNSGGCLLDINGKVIGINSAIFSPSGGNVGIGFAIPSDIAQKTIEQLMQFGRTKRGWLGVKIQNLTENMAESLGLKSQGAIVGSVTPDGPAQKAGIQSGDVILEFDGKVINESNRLSRLVGETPIGKACSIKIWRKGKEIPLQVTVGEFEDALQKGKIDGEEKHSDGKSAPISEALGIKVSSIPQEIKQRYAQSGPLKGVFIVKVDSNSSAAEEGLMRGDIIVEANIETKRQELNEPKDFSDFVESAKRTKHKNILLLVMRNGEPKYFSLKIDEELENKSKENKKNEPKSFSSAPSDLKSGNSVPFSKDDAKPKRGMVPDHPANKDNASGPAA
ncbi:Do family serine endopeptidase [Candidatus Finniella inopinata]|uniref:Do family serine endopeptidase n=1 Tax=Candidatus Finniella inopinata TaxID=1696036 RepID=A0A4Q7DI75_9PROT|nr:Do family serine endopeptidase [Candidatus Finniella inopinata]RZI46402.1 Do family serine endopeptidase [Candidatus Finniella inopinata]